MPWEITLMRVNGKIINQKDMGHNNFKESLSMMDSSKMVNGTAQDNLLF